MKKVLIYISIILLLTPFIVEAETCDSSKIVIESITLNNKSENVIEFGEATTSGINLNLVMVDVGDNAKYNLLIKNNSNNDYWLNEKLINSNSDYIAYYFENEDNNNVIKANSSKNVLLNVQYAKEIPNDKYENGTYTVNEEVLIKVSNTKNIGDSIINPKTGITSFVSLLILIIILSLVFLVILRKKKFVSLNILIFITIILIPTSIYGICKQDIVVNSKITIELPSYSLQIDPNGGEFNESSGITEINLLKNSTLEINEPTRKGYTFNGWTLSGKNSIIENGIFEMGSENAKLTANWIVNSYILTIDSAGGVFDGNTTVSLNYQDSITISDPIKEGYTFIGWTVEGGNLSNNIYTMNDDFNSQLTANWIINKYAYLITHSQMNTNGSGYTLIEADSESGEIEYGTVITPNTKNYIGFTSPSTRSLTIDVDTVPPIKNILNYNYTRNKYTITIKDGTNTSTRNEYYDSRIHIDTPTKDYYNFNGWNTTGVNVEDEYLIVPANNITLTSTYTPIVYNISYNLDGGTLDNKIETYTFESDEITLGTPIKEDYIFLGWTGSNGNTPQNNVVIPRNSNGNKIFRANWKSNNPNATESILNLVENANSNSTSLISLDPPSDESCTNTLAYDGTEDNNLRFVGYNPCNYVSFNDELWRIIGVMNNIDDGNGDKSTRLKIRRNEPIGGYSFDSSDETINSGYGINEWSQSDLMNELNGDYLNANLTEDVYWFNDRYNNKTNLFNYTKVLSNDSQQLIDTVLWNLGGIKTSYNASQLYISERGTDVVKPGVSCSGNTCNDNVTRTTSWVGKIGLIYPSDYLYATSGALPKESGMDREYCLNRAANRWDLVNGCYNKDWIQTNNYTYLWTINPISNSAISGVSVAKLGHISGDTAYYGASRAVFPTLYLKTNVFINGGSGTQSDPYTLYLKQ